MDAQDLDISPLLPRFRSDEAEARFREEDARDSLSALRNMTLLSALIAAVFDITDTLFASEVLTQLRLIRFGLVLPVLGSFLALTWWRSFPKHRDWLLVVGLALCWLGTLAMDAIFPSVVDLNALGIGEQVALANFPLSDGKLFFVIAFAVTTIFGGVAAGVMSFRPALALAALIIPLAMAGHATLGASSFSLAFGLFSGLVSAGVAVFLSYQLEMGRRHAWRKEQLAAAHGAAPGAVAAEAAEPPSAGAGGAPVKAPEITLERPGFRPTAPDPSWPTTTSLEEPLSLAGLEPRRFGRYEILSSLGVGGMAQVFLVRAPGVEGVGRPMALKRLLSRGEASDRAHRSLVHEARILSELSHPNLVQAYALEEIDGCLCMLMEYVDGLSLERLLATLRWAEHPLSSEEVAWVAVALCQGLAYAHGYVSSEGEALGLVHRDIKPANILITHDGQVKLADFGIAKTALAASRATTHGVLKGTLSYMSPEQATGQPVDARADLFALGLVIYEALTLDPFVKAQHLSLLVSEVVGGFRGEARDRVEAAAPLWVEILGRLLAPDPADRFPSADALQEAIEARFKVASPRELADTLATAAAPREATPAAPSDFSAPGEPHGRPLYRQADDPR